MKITDNKNVLRLIQDLCNKHPDLKTVPDFRSIRNAGFRKLAYQIDGVLNPKDSQTKSGGSEKIYLISDKSILALLEEGVRPKTKVHNKLAGYWLHIMYPESWPVNKVITILQNPKEYGKDHCWEQFLKLTDVKVLKENHTPDLNPEQAESTPAIAGSNKHIYLNRLNARMDRKNLLVLEGVTGCGKSSLIDSLIADINERGSKNLILHPTISPGLTFNSFINELRLFADKDTDVSDGANADRLMAYLQSQNAILILDDFENADEKSFIPLLEKASAIQGTTRIIVAHNRCFRYLFRMSSEVFIMNGFSLLELEGFLQQKGIILDEESLEDLLTKTDGVQTAVEIFKEMYQSSYTKPQEMIARLDKESDYRTWVESVLMELEPENREYVQLLSLLRGEISAEQAIEMGAKFDIVSPSANLEQLTDRFLVREISRNGQQFVRVLRPIADYYCNQLKGTGNKEQHLSLAEYFWQSRLFYQKKDFSTEELDLVLKSIHHYQQAGEFDKSQYFLHRILKYLKRYGSYEAIIENTQYEIRQNKSRSDWVDWECAHALFITGRTESAYHTLVRLLKKHFSDNDSYDESSDITIEKTTKFFQLYAEILDQFGKPELGLSILHKSLSLFDISEYDWWVRSHAVSVMAWLYFKNGDADKALEITQDLLDELAMADRGRAVALIRMGIFIIKKGKIEEAVSCLTNALALLQSEPIVDNRAIAWCSLHLAYSCQLTGNVKEAEINLERCLTISRSRRLFDTDYYRLLHEMNQPLHNTALSGLMKQEKERLRKIQDQVNLFLKQPDLSRDFKILDSFIIGRANDQFDYRTLMKPIDYTPKKIASKASRSVIKSAKNNPENVIKNLFDLKTNIRQIFGSHFYNKLITECLKESDNKQFIMDTYIIPYLYFIIELNDKKDKVKLHYARALEYAGEEEHARVLLAAIKEANWHFEYYVIKGNCFKKDFHSAYDLYQKASALAYTERQKGRVMNNTAGLIYAHKKREKYPEAKELFESARSHWRRNWKKSLFAISGRILLEIDEAPLETLVQRVQDLAEQYSLNHKDISAIIDQADDLIKKKKLRLAFSPPASQ